MSSEISDFQNFSVLSDFYAGDVPDQVTLRLEDGRRCDRHFPTSSPERRKGRTSTHQIIICFNNASFLFCSLCLTCANKLDPRKKTLEELGPLQ